MTADDVPAHRYLAESIEDASVVTRCLDGDTAAFEVLVSRYQRVLFGLALRMLGDHADAGDATQTAFAKVFENLDTYDPRHRFFSWTYRILRNECLNLIRARRPQEALPELATVRGPHEVLVDAERRCRVLAALLALPPVYREVVVLRHYAGRSYEDIGVALQISDKTVKSRLHTARQRLAQLLLAWDAS